jgi:pimeloyl-ACP methyl ester carboxylesterase
MSVSYHTKKVGDVDVFYREAGQADAPVILLLHGFPTAGHMFRDLIPQLSVRYRVIAPDLPGFGNTKCPPRGQFDYTFDNLARVVWEFIEALGLIRYVLYVFDYGAPTGFRLALAHPERVSAIISQNGNAYLEGLSDAWGPWQTYWREPTPEHREACRASLSPEVIRDWQYLSGADASRVSPDGYTLDIAYMARSGAEEIHSIWSWTIEAMWPCTQLSRRISGNNSRRFWRLGEKMIPLSCQLERMPINAIFLKPKYIYSIRGTLRLKPMPRKSARSF